MDVSINHVSVLVKNVRDASVRFEKAGYVLGEFDSFDSEGTEEVYIGPREKTSLLLLQAGMKPGPYMRAYQKRGVGLHHVALDVADLFEFSHFMGKIGWLLHPISLSNFREKRAIYFARPGVNVLFEVEEREPSRSEYFVETVKVPVASGNEKFIDDLKMRNIQAAGKGEFSLQIGDRVWKIQDFA